MTSIIFRGMSPDLLPTRGRDFLPCLLLSLVVAFLHSFGFGVKGSALKVISCLRFKCVCDHGRLEVLIGGLVLVRYFVDYLLGHLAVCGVGDVVRSSSTTYPVMMLWSRRSVDEWL